MQQEKDSIFKMDKRSGHHTKEDKQMVNEDKKDVQHDLPLGKYILRPQCHSTTPHRMAKIRNTDNIKCCQECGATGTLILC